MLAHVPHDFLRAAIPGRNGMMLGGSGGLNEWVKYYRV